LRKIVRGFRYEVPASKNQSLSVFIGSICLAYGLHLAIAAAVKTKANAVEMTQSSFPERHWMAARFQRDYPRGGYMKRYLTSLLALGLLLAASAHAQTAMKVNIPFDFVVNGHNMSAGEYRVGSLGNGGDAIALQGTDNAIALTFACRAGEPSATSKLIFHRYGTEYFLAQVWNAGQNSGRQLPSSAAEREIASGPVKAQLVAVAAMP